MPFDKDNDGKEVSSLSNEKARGLPQKKPVSIKNFIKIFGNWVQEKFMPSPSPKEANESRGASTENNPALSSASETKKEWEDSEALQVPKRKSSLENLDSLVKEPQKAPATANITEFVKDGYESFSSFKEQPQPLLQRSDVLLKLQVSIALLEQAVDHRKELKASTADNLAMPHKNAAFLSAAFSEQSGNEIEDDVQVKLSGAKFIETRLILASLSKTGLQENKAADQNKLIAAIYKLERHEQQSLELTPQPRRQSHGHSRK